MSTVSGITSSVVCHRDNPKKIISHWDTPGTMTFEEMEKTAARYPTAFIGRVDRIKEVFLLCFKKDDLIKSKFKRSVCWSVLRGEACPRDMCDFAHTPEVLWAANRISVGEYYKSRICDDRNYECKGWSNCIFAHKGHLWRNGDKKIEICRVVDHSYRENEMDFLGSLDTSDPKNYGEQLVWAQNNPKQFWNDVCTIQNLIKQNSCLFIKKLNKTPFFKRIMCNFVHNIKGCEKVYCEKAHKLTVLFAVNLWENPNYKKDICTLQHNDPYCSHIHEGDLTQDLAVWVPLGLKKTSELSDDKVIFDQARNLYGKSNRTRSPVTQLYN